MFRVLLLAVLGCGSFFTLGVFAALAIKASYEENVRDWLAQRAEARAKSPAYRKALYWKAFRVSQEVEAFASATGDEQMRLLGLVMVQSVVKVSAKPGDTAEIAWRMNRLRDAADAVAVRCQDKWWRAHDHWSKRRLDEIIRKVARDSARQTRPTETLMRVRPK